MWDPFANFESGALPNGLTVYAAHWPDRPWQHVNILVHSGAWHDRQGVEGTAHFMEHLVSENGGSSATEIEDFFRPYASPRDIGLGATSYADTYYYFPAPADKEVLSRALQIFGQMLIPAKLEKFIERERQVIVGEFRQDFPSNYEYDLALRKQEVLYPGHRLGRSTCPLGTFESLARITQADLQTFYDTHYTPANMSIITLGGMSLEEMLRLLLASPFALQKEGERSSLFVPVTDLPVPTENRHVVNLSEVRSTDVEVGEYLTIATLPGTFSNAAVNIFSELLNKVLFKEVRLDRAWTYDVGSGWTPVCGFYEYGIEAKALAREAMDEIEDVIDSCITLVGQNVKAFEVQRASALTRMPMLDLPGKDVCSSAMHQLLTRGHIPLVSEMRDEVQAVTFEDIQSIVALLRPSRRYTQISFP